MLTGNIQSMTQSFISNIELVCAPICRLPCRAIRSSMETLQTNNCIIPVICTMTGTILGAGIPGVIFERLSLPTSVSAPIVALCGFGLGFLSFFTSLYCLRKMDTHTAFPDPVSDSEMMLSELSEMVEHVTKDDAA